LERGETPASYFGVGFHSMAQMLAIFTPKRLELIARLRAEGPLSVAALAHQLGRSHKSALADLDALTEWMAVEHDESGRVFVPVG
jgi:predicted transcriptional regulator